MITLGGDAELELVDSLDPFSEGVVFSVRPPKKSKYVELQVIHKLFLIPIQSRVKTCFGFLISVF